MNCGVKMNFPPFGNHFPGGIPSIHGFAAKFSAPEPAPPPPQPQSGAGPPPSAGGGGGRPEMGTQTGNIAEETSLVNSGRYGGGGGGGQFGGGQQGGQEPVKYQRDSSTQVGGSSDMIQSPPPPPPVSKYQEIHHFNIPLAYHNGRTGQDEESTQSSKREDKGTEYQPSVPPSWQSIAAPGSTVADYLSHLPASTLPLSLHHFLKYSAENIKKDAEPEHQPPPPPQPDVRRRLNKKKKPPKEKKPRQKPGDIRLTTASDGSTLYCCPECHMAYPDKGLLEQHLLGHTLERRFFCDVCGAGLKRKDHLTRHKQSHNPERPFICSVCMKAFKRKEQLTLHFVIHSGEKRHVCPECGKGFYRKDHLRKHTRSHVARRVKTDIGSGASEGVS